MPAARRVFSFINAPAALSFLRKMVYNILLKTTPKYEAEDTDMPNTQNPIVSWLFETDAVRVCPEGQPFWYTSGKLGPF